MKAHPTDTHLLVPRSRSSANVKVKYQGHVSQKMGVSGALVFHKHILFCFVFCPSNSEQDINLIDFHYSRPSNKIYVAFVMYPVFLFRPCIDVTNFIEFIF